MNPGSFTDRVHNAWKLIAFLLNAPSRKLKQRAALGAAYDDGSWRDAPVSFDQMRIERHLLELPLADKRLLHIGIGSSHLAKTFHDRCLGIDGITVMEDEVALANNLGIRNYRAYLMDKYSDAIAGLPNKYDYIIDNNPSSFASSRESVDAMIARYVNLLKEGGAILTDTIGMSYHRPLSFPMKDQDLMAFERVLPVKYVKLSRKLRALVKNTNEERIHRERSIEAQS